MICLRDLNPLSKELHYCFIIRGMNKKYGYQINRIYLKNCRGNNITRAAEKLYITQSALNQQLLKLEKELGTPPLLSFLFSLSTYRRRAYLYRWCPRNFENKKSLTIEFMMYRMSEKKLWPSSYSRKKNQTFYSRLSLIQYVERFGGTKAAVKWQYIYR